MFFSIRVYIISIQLFKKKFQIMTLKKDIAEANKYLSNQPNWQIELSNPSTADRV